MSARIQAVILAAGLGRRLGYPKAALKLKEQWMLPKISRALRQGGVHWIDLVLSQASEAAIAKLGSPGVDRILLNSEPELGRTGSLLCALEPLPFDVEGLLVHPCDVPLISTSCVDQVLQSWRRQGRCREFLARPVTPTGRGGHPLLIGSAFLDEIRTYAPDQPLRDLLRAHPTQLVNVPITGDPGPFLDVDTPEHHALLESFLEQASHSSSDPHDPRCD